MMTLFDTPTRRDAKLHMRALIGLALADGKIARSEYECLLKIAKARGLGNESLKRMIRNHKNTPISLPDSLDAKFEQLFDLCQVMLADGVIDEKETEFCEQVALRLGLSKITSGLLVRKITDGLLAELPKEEIREESEAFLS